MNIFCCFHSFLFILLFFLQGKTTIVQSLLRHLDELHPGVKIGKILICYSLWQKKYDQIQNMLGDRVTFQIGLPSRETIMELTRDENLFSLIILDDLMWESSNSDIVRELFTSISHHRSCYTWLILQNIFIAGKEMRTITLSAQGLILTRLV